MKKIIYSILNAFSTILVFKGNVKLLFKSFFIYKICKLNYLIIFFKIHEFHEIHEIHHEISYPNMNS